MIERKEISTAPNEPRDVYYRYGGKEMGRVSNNGDFNMDYAASISDRTITPDTNNTDGAFRHGSTTGSSSADFDQNYQAINSYDQGSTAGDYVVRGGETLSSIAAQVYGDSLLWYKIAQANGLSVDAALVEGTSLRLPAGVTRNTYNASTFKPYDPGEAIGDVSPTTPEPPKQNKCGVFGQILLAVVAVAVTVVTGNPLLANLASQGVGLATGIQEKFDFKGLALSAIGGGVARGVNAAVGVGKTALGAGLRAAASSAITQGIGVATGLQDKFSWAGVAGAGIGAGIGFKVGELLPGSAVAATANSPGTPASFGNQLGSHTASAIANAATRSAIDGSNFGDNIIRSIPDVIGQALGGAIGDGLGKTDFLDKLGPVGDVIKFVNDVTDTVYAPVETIGTEIGRALFVSDVSFQPQNPSNITIKNDAKFQTKIQQSSNAILEEIIVTGQKRISNMLSGFSYPTEAIQYQKPAELVERHITNIDRDHSSILPDSRNHFPTSQTPLSLQGLNNSQVGVLLQVLAIEDSYQLPNYQLSDGMTLGTVAVPVDKIQGIYDSLFAYRSDDGFAVLGIYEDGGLAPAVIYNNTMRGTEQYKFTTERNTQFALTVANISAAGLTGNASLRIATSTKTTSFSNTGSSRYIRKNTTPIVVPKKRGPKTDPNAPHNATINKLHDLIEDMGGTVTHGGRGKEIVTPTLGGMKNSRRADIIFEMNGFKGGINVGKTNASGMPVTREIHAMNDLNNFGDLPMWFLRYD